MQIANVNNRLALVVNGGLALDSSLSPSRRWPAYWQLILAVMGLSIMTRRHAESEKSLESQRP